MHRKQKKIAFAQLMVDLPNFILVLVLALVSGSMIIWIDVLDSLGYVLRSSIIVLISKKLLRDLRYEYNYGSSKIETMVALLCDGIIFGGLIIVVGVCFYELCNPSRPDDMVLGGAILKLAVILLDIIFLRAQKKIVKEKGGAIAQSSYASYVGALLFDCVAMISLVIAWAFRNSPISWYFSPVVSILLAIYLIGTCLKRVKLSINELTDKTLPEEMQLKILKVMSGFYDQYSQMHFVKSHKYGDTIVIDIALSFEADTPYSRIQALKEQMQEEISQLIDNCTVNLHVY